LFVTFEMWAGGPLPKIVVLCVCIEEIIFKQATVTVMLLKVIPIITDNNCFD